ncbi:hypothetical protein OG943_16785 [Amycolatopsis sp. NBC_00345]|uniref:hypothetical protein n=1 Tax=Amycolatopsis sp. NBC_00345 TaxID=2975955 RepID=UPI002E2614CB
MASSHSHRISTGSPAKSRLATAGVSVVFALVVAGGAKGAFELSGTMMTNVALMGAWLMFTLGLAYAAVRLRPRIGLALLAGFGLGAFLVVIFGGMQILS